MYTTAAFRSLYEQTLEEADDFYNIYTETQDVGIVNGKSKRDILTDLSRDD
jgi:hypothetical protein